MYTTSTQVVVLEFDQAMDVTSLPISNGNLIKLNANAENRRCRLPVSWLDATHLSLMTALEAIVVPADTTRCADTSGMISAGAGTQAQTWDEFPLTIVP